MAEPTIETAEKTVVPETAEDSDSESEVDRPQRERKKIDHYAAEQTTVERKPREITEVRTSIVMFPCLLLLLANTSFLITPHRVSPLRAKELSSLIFQM